MKGGTHELINPQASFPPPCHSRKQLPRLPGSLPMGTPIDWLIRPAVPVREFKDKRGTHAMISCGDLRRFHSWALLIHR